MCVCVCQLAVLFRSESAVMGKLCTYFDTHVINYIKIITLPFSNLTTLLTNVEHGQ